jgi:hypothetical protein
MRRARFLIFMRDHPRLHCLNLARVTTPFSASSGSCAWGIEWSKGCCGVYLLCHFWSSSVVAFARRWQPLKLIGLHVAYDRF